MVGTRRAEVPRQCSSERGCPFPGTRSEWLGGMFGENGVFNKILTSPGGMSFLSTQYGWAANNVVNYQVVLANGTIVDANEDENTGKFISRYASAHGPG